MIFTNEFYTIFENYEEACGYWDDYDTILKIWIEDGKLKTTNSRGDTINFTKTHCKRIKNKPADDLMNEITEQAFKERPKQTLKEFNDSQILRNKKIHIDLYSEKNTDSLMMRYYDNLFKTLFNYSRIYYTKTNRKFINFNHKIPDGYDVINDEILVIIENKADKKDFENAKLQIEEYKNIVKDSFKTIYLIIGLGTENLKIHFYKNSINNEIEEKDFIEQLQEIKPRNNNIFNIHKLNQFLYDENINLGNVNEKIKTLYELYKISKDIKQVDLFNVNFNFVNLLTDNLNPVFTDYYVQIIKYFVNNIKNNTENIIDEIFNEVLIYSDEHENTNKEGTVITPSYVSYLMSYFMKDAKDLIVYDPCCGNCALELYLLNKNNKFYLNDKDADKVELSKMFMNFNNMTYQIVNKDAFKIPVPKDTNFIIMNPPYIKDKKRLTSKFEINLIVDVIEKAKKLDHVVYLSAVIPTNDFKKSKFLDYLRENTEIICTIKLNKDAFAPMASIDTSIITLKINSNLKTLKFPCYNAINDNAYEIGRGKEMKRIVENFDVDELEFVEIDVSENSFICLFNDDIKINFNEFKPYFDNNCKGLIRSILTNKNINTTNIITNQNIEKIRNKEHELNQKIYNKYKNLLDVNDKLILFIMYKLNLDFKQNILPFDDYIKCKFETFDDTDFTIKLYNTLKSKIKINQIEELIKNFNETIDIEAFFEDIAKHAINKETDSKDGIVFTNKIIVNNMIKSLNIDKNDEFLDFCCGSGNFPIAASKFNPKSITGIEISKLTSILAKLLLQTENQNYKIYCDNAFNDTYTKNKLYDKIAINPPYNGKLDDKNFELVKKFTSTEIPEKFIVFGINKLKNNGLLSVVISNSCLRNKKLLDYIRQTCEVVEVITYDAEMFKESKVNFGVSQITVRKTNNPKIKTFKCHYFDKGYKLSHNIIKKYSEPQITETIEKSIVDNDWNFTKNCEFDFENMEIKNDIIMSSIDNYVNNIDFSNCLFDIDDLETVKIRDIFEIVKNKETHDKNESFNYGNFPLVGSSKINNGTIGYLNDYDYEKGLYTLSSFGSCGFLFKQYVNFNIRGHGSVIILTNKIDFDNLINCPLISYQLSKHYSWAHAINNENFYDIEVKICKTSNPELSKFMNDVLKNFKLPVLDLDPKKIVKVKLSDIFNIVNIKEYIIKDKENIYPTIGAGKINNGISEYGKGYRFENLYTIVKTGDGGAGYVFYHPYKFNKTNSVLVVKPLIKLNPLINCSLLSKQLHSNFNRANPINQNNFNNIEIFIYDQFSQKL